jgi:hypothetical protein
LVGLIDRVEALGGTLRFTSPLGAGTTPRVMLPIEPEGARLDRPTPRPELEGSQGR